VQAVKLGRFGYMQDIAGHKLNMELDLQSLFGLHVLFFDFTLSPIIDLKDAGSRRVKC
jgi:hypothetical protein